MPPTSWADIVNPHGAELDNRYFDALKEDGSQDDESEYRRRARAYDPRKALREDSQGAYDEIFNGVGGVGDQLDDLKGSAVGAGRLDTGFFDRDQGKVMMRGQADLNSRIKQGALQASGLELENNNAYGNFGTNVRSRYLDLLSGGLDRRQGQRNADQASSDNLISSIASFVPFLL